MKKRLSYSPKAVSDLDGIWDYTERQWGADQARLYTRAIHDACLRLLTGEAGAGRYRLGGTTLLKLRVGLHLAFLAESEEGLLVVRILHVRQDIDHQLG